VLHGLVMGANPPAEWTDAVQKNFTQFLRTHTRLPKAWLPLGFGKWHVLSPEEAREYGIVDVGLDEPAGRADNGVN